MVPPALTMHFVSALLRACLAERVCVGLGAWCRRPSPCSKFRPYCLILALFLPASQSVSAAIRGISQTLRRNDSLGTATFTGAPRKRGRAPVLHILSSCLCLATQFCHRCCHYGGLTSTGGMHQAPCSGNVHTGTRPTLHGELSWPPPRHARGIRYIGTQRLGPAAPSYLCARQTGIHASTTAAVLYGAVWRGPIW